jgi:hypothetical protein
MTSLKRTFVGGAVLVTFLFIIRPLWGIADWLREVER